MPDSLAPYSRASSTEKLRRACVVLVEARRLYKSHRGTLLECLIEAGQGGLQGWWARQLVQAAIWDLDIEGWEAAPDRRRADVTRVLDQVIRKARNLRGGWRVTGLPAPQGAAGFEDLRRGISRRGWKPTLVASAE